MARLPLFVVGLSLLALAGVGCAGEAEEDDDSSNAAVSTPREVNEDAAARAREAQARAQAPRMDELRKALDKAEATDFVGDVPFQLGDFFRLVKQEIATREVDPNVQYYPFRKTSRPAYVFEAKAKKGGRNFYIYDSDIIAGYPEYNPRPLGLCNESAKGKPLTCKTTSEGATLPDPTHQNSRR